MSAERTLEDLRSRIIAHYTLIFLTTWEEERWESELATLALDMRRGLVTWSMTQGFQPPLTESEQLEADPARILHEIRGYPSDHVFLLKDFHPYLTDPVVVRTLRDLVSEMRGENKTVLMLGPESPVPVELERDVAVMELPLPDTDDLREVLNEVAREEQEANGRKLTITDEEREKMCKAIVGLTQREAAKAFSRGLQGREKIDDDVYSILVSEKKSLMRGSELLEFYDLSAGIKDIGGLEGLKDWLVGRASAYSDKARRAGLPLPKGALLLGVQGCGKSLTARAAAKLLSFPLVRLDIAALLSSDRGSSEKNMRDALTTIETVAPAVLWLDEVEKAFAGVTDGGGGDGTLTRLFGTFLTWMQDHGKPIFTIATANSVQNLPPEMLRRGRFDELFFINLPNFHERKSIIAIHMSKRKLKPELFDVEKLANRTEGYSGAELEQVIISAMFDCYTTGRRLNTDALIDAQEQTVPLSVTMEEKIFELREWARTRCRPATPDSRVMQMLEEEARMAE
ncbi:MAG TPA: AAA family ATPase [Planctomycetaceae bacterium]|nr:AAA family ATPase [Planctomycetaceae bacterium]